MFLMLCREYCKTCSGASHIKHKMIEICLSFIELWCENTCLITSEAVRFTVKGIGRKICYFRIRLSGAQKPEKCSRPTFNIEARWIILDRNILLVIASTSTRDVVYWQEKELLRSAIVSNQQLAFPWIHSLQNVESMQQLYLQLQVTYIKEKRIYINAVHRILPETRWVIIKEQP